MCKRHHLSWFLRLCILILSLSLAASRAYAADHDSEVGSAAVEENQGVSEAAQQSPESHGAAGHGVGGEESGSVVLGLLEHHLMDSNHYQFLGMDFHLPVLSIGRFQLPVTKHTIMLIMAGILVMVLVIPLRRTGKNVPHGFANFLEVIIVFLRDEVVYPSLGGEDGRKYLPYFLTVFFFILFSNLLGMIPYGSTPTGNISVTGSLAGVSLLIMIGSGVVRHGPIKYMASYVPHGVPMFVVPVLFPIEIIGILVKHFALCIRLFANMLAGHAVITVFLGLISSYFIAPVAILGAVGISLLELFVAFLQAYIFTILSSLFIGMALHPEH